MLCCAPAGGRCAAHRASRSWRRRLLNLFAGAMLFVMPNPEHHYLEINDTRDGALLDKRNSHSAFPTFTEGEQFIFNDRITQVTRVVSSSGDGPDGVKYFRTLVWITYS